MAYEPNSGAIWFIYAFTCAENQFKSVSSRKPVICCLLGNPYWSGYPSLAQRMHINMRTDIVQ